MRFAIVAVLALSALATPAAAQKEIRISIALPQTSQLGAGIDAFAKAVNEKSGGKYKILTFYSGALGNEREQIEAVQLGSHEMAFATTAALPSFVPETKILDIPFLFRDYAHARAVLDGPIGDKLLQDFPKKGMVALVWGENGFRNITSNKPVREPADLKGMKLRTQENPIHIAAFRALGAAPTPMPITEVFTALQQGTVDGQENPLSIIISNKFDQVQKYLSISRHAYSAAVIIMNKAAFDALPKADQAMFIEAAREAVKANRARVDEDEKSGIATLKQRGMTIIDPVDTAAFQKALAPTFAEFGKQFGAAAIQQIQDVK
ncbi:TRAP transporter substrate-binding protein [Xanthobacter sp. VNH20]|uniref:TRAP transporter substrate-binding protein n=1 Tax=Xanthobacter sp. VNH20 TaxID=3156616 RepID=UPI0032B5CF97